MKKFLIAATFAFVSHVGFAQEDALKKDVLKVIELSGSASQMKLAKDQILQMVPKEKQAAFILEFDATLPSLYDKMAKIYMDTYTKEDIKAMLAFYESPVGKKITANAGAVAEKSQAAGQEWGQGLQTMMMKYVQQ
ncbi:DUF2059 domain-containing protein [Flavobacterium sp.]|uniref:DUF2059 domain-containing protein n=1 Tax=Flavobacterium sp. TaxID=239 RepID=UPI002FD99D5E